VTRTATSNGSGLPTAGWLVLELSVGVEHNAESVISKHRRHCERG
jgi:hypothetical protein